MSKRIECLNCRNMYDCERTYLGGCTDGEEWSEEETGGNDTRTFQNGSE